MNITQDQIRKLYGAGILSVGTLLVLMQIDEATTLDKPPTPGELAVKLGMPVSTVSRVVYELVTLGLVEYGLQSGDRRKKLLRVNRTKLNKLFDGKTKKAAA